jgi:[ribosomal protein S5]-alanine N-acetyltransferase
MSSEILRTPRLSLRCPAASDLDILYSRVLSDADVMRFVFHGGALSLARAAAFFQSEFDHAGSGLGLGTLVESESGEIVGFAGLVTCNALGIEDHEFGFVLARPFWGKGYATEIGRGQIDYGLGVLKFRRLLALVSPANAASIATIRKLGMCHHSNVLDGERGERLVYVIDAP